jgi:hypothetical protein
MDLENGEKLNGDTKISRAFLMRYIKRKIRTRLLPLNLELTALYV